MDFTVKGAKIEYMVHCIWLTLQVHLSMDEFVRDGLKYNSAISAAFVWFLTKRTGSNVGLGFSGLISKLEEWVKSVEGAIKEAVKKAKMRPPHVRPMQARPQTWSRLGSQICTPTTPGSRNDYLLQLGCAGGEQVPRRSNSFHRSFGASRHRHCLLRLWGGGLAALFHC